MKRYPLLILLFALLPLAPVVALEKGREYLVLPAPQPVETGNKIEVREFFWYGCPHCYALEPFLSNWLKRKPANVEFVRTPATSPRWLVHAQAYYTFASLGVTEKAHAALFRAIHEQRRPLDDEASLIKFATEQGIDGEKFKEAFNSFGVRTNIERAKRQNEAFQVSSVPMIAVDGKYITSAGMVGGDEALMKAIDALVAQAARERAATKPPVKSTTTR